MNEHELIALLQQRDEPAFRWLVEHYRNRVFSTILNIVQDEAESEDATQEVFIQVYESIGTFRKEATLSTWIYRVAVRKAIDKARRKKLRRRLQQWIPGWMNSEKQSVNTIFHHPGVMIEQKEKADALFRAIDLLPGKQKMAFTMIKVQGMSYDEVTGIMKMNTKAIESLISRAKVNLQKKLEAYRQNK